MAKKLLLAAASLGIVLVLFFVYHFSTTPRRPQGLQIAQGDIDHEDLLDHTATTQPTRVLKLRGVPIPPGSKPRVTVYDRKGQAKIRFRARTWEPLSETEFHMEEPEIELLMPGGQITHIRADRGNVVVQRTEKGNYDPKRGRLEGHVRIFIDRTTKKWRQAHPDRSAPEQHPELLIKIWLDNVSFDVDLARLETKGPLRVQSVEANIEGHGLVLRWNQVDNRIEYLEITRGRMMELRRGGQLVDFAIPGSERETIQPAPSPERARAAEEAGPIAAAAANRPTPATAFESLANRPAAVERPRGPRARSPSSRPSATPAGRAERRRAKKTLEPERIDTYVAEFQDDIVVEQRKGAKVSGRLEADRLALTFEFGSKQREAVKEQPTSRPARRGITAPGDETRLRVTWTGKMVMRPVGEARSEATGDRLDVLAIGKPVRLKDKQGLVLCRKLVYQNETQQVWLHGSDAEPVRLVADKGRTLTGRTIFLDRKRGIAQIRGPGSMTDKRRPVAAVEVPRGPAPTQRTKDRVVRIRWSRGVNLAFGLMRSRQRDPKTGRLRIKTREYIRHAVFEGQAEMVQADQSIRADRIEVYFGKPRSANSLADVVERVNAVGQVRLTHAEDLVRCEKLLVEMTTDAGGRSIPKTAHAFGHVVAQQGARRIEASDHLEVVFAAVRKVPEPIDLDKARAIARARGLDPDAIDWQAVQAKRRGKTILRITSLQAFGNVRAVDPGERLDLTADVLQAELPDGRNIDRAVVIGTEAQMAVVQLQDYLIRGRRIEMDLPKQHAAVPGRGTLEFLSRRDLDGRRLAKPLPVAVSWSQGMTLTGQYNVGIFEGDVHAVSRNSRLDCQQLRIDFAPVPPDQETVQVRAGPVRGPDLWIFAPLVRSAPKPASGDALRTRFNKRPILITARGDAVALRSTYDERTGRLLSRMRIAGPQITVDLKAEAMNVEGRGNLLIEDYRPPRRRRTARRPVDSLLGGIESSGPSQTLFTWANAMSFFVSQNLAYFDRMVHMTHYAGGAMVLARELADAMKVDVNKLAAMKQRRATLDCDTLLVKFLTDPRGAGRTGGRAAGLAQLEAVGRVVLCDSGKTLMGERVTYDHASELVTVHGGPRTDARILDEHGRQFMWTGPELAWDRKNDRVIARGATIIAAGR